MNNMQRNFRDKNAGLRALANGGKVTGPGGPTDDTAGTFALSKGEYVLPADTVKAVGKQNLDALKDRTHEPAPTKAQPGAALRMVGMADGGIVDPDLAYPNANGLQAKDVLGPGGARVPPAAAAAQPAVGPDISADFAKRTSALRANTPLSGTPGATPPPAAAAAEAVPGATGPAADAVNAAGNAAKTGLAGRILRGGLGVGAVGLGVYGAKNAYDNAEQNALDSTGNADAASNAGRYAATNSAFESAGSLAGAAAGARAGGQLPGVLRFPGVVAGGIIGGLGGQKLVENALGEPTGKQPNELPKGVYQASAVDDVPHLNAAGQAAPTPLNTDVTALKSGAISPADFEAKFGRGTASGYAAQNVRAAPSGSTASAAGTLPNVPQLSAAPQPGNSGGSYTVNGKTVTLSPQDVANLGGRLQTVPSGVAPNPAAGVGQANGLGQDDTTSQVLRQLLGSGGLNQRLIPQDRSREINDYYDNLENTAKKSFTSPQGQGNLVRHLVDIGQARNQALGQDAGRLTGAAESDASNRSGNLRTVADIVNQQHQLQAQQFQRSLELARLDRQFALDQRKYGEDSASSVNDYTERQFVGPDGKPDAASASAFRQFLNENPQKYGGGRSLSDLPAKERYAALDQAVTDFKQGAARNAAVGGNIGGRTTNSQVTYGAPRNPELGDIGRGAGVLPTLGNIVKSHLPGVNAVNYQVSDDSLGNSVPVSPLVRDENGNISADRLRRLSGE